MQQPQPTFPIKNDHDVVTRIPKFLTYIIVIKFQSSMIVDHENFQSGPQSGDSNYDNHVDQPRSPRDLIIMKCHIYQAPT